jgi:hypothetical protein
MPGRTSRPGATTTSFMTPSTTELLSRRIVTFVASSPGATVAIATPEDRAMKNLSGMNVAILVENGSEQVKLIKPRKALVQVGAETRIVSPQLE